MATDNVAQTEPDRKIGTGKDRKDRADALKVVPPGGRTGFLAANKILVKFPDGSRGVYWATPAETRKRAAESKKRTQKKPVKKKAAGKSARKKSTPKKPARRKKAKKATRKKKAAPTRARRTRRVKGAANLSRMANGELSALHAAVTKELKTRIRKAESEVSGLKAALK